MLEVASFKQHLLEQGVLHPEGTHHEFAYGTHGQKLDFDLIPGESPLYGEWVDISVATIRLRYPKLPYAVLGTANGTNRLARDTAAKLEIEALYTRKISPREVVLIGESRDKLKSAPEGADLDVVVVEDVGTTGGTAYTAAKSAVKAGADEVKGLFTWQRRERLEAFKWPYYSIIDKLLPTFTPDQCRKIGYCALGWELIPHGE